MRNVLIVVGIVLALSSCQQKKETLTAQQIVDKAREAAGSQLLNDSRVKFDFRDMHYTLERRPGYYRYTREQTDSLGNKIMDQIGTEGYRRQINDSVVQVHDTMVVKYSNSINSVHYFAYLPFNLNDPAVNKKLLGEVTIKNIDYYKIQVSFDQQGGGDDFQDVFLYWFRKDNFQMDYLAYLYHTEGGGIRFREAFNRRVVAGIHFLDYRNLKPKATDYTTVDFLKIDSLFEAKQLEMLSEILIENIEVELIK